MKRMIVGLAALVCMACAPDEDLHVYPVNTMVIYVGTPNSTTVQTMFFHAEFLEDVHDPYEGWEWSQRYVWTDGITLEFHPGDVEGVRFNATYCQDETEDESDSSCNNWLAYGQTDDEAYITAVTEVVYDGASYNVGITTFCWDSDGNGENDSCGSSALSEFLRE